MMNLSCFRVYKTRTARLLALRLLSLLLSLLLFLPQGGHADPTPNYDKVTQLMNEKKFVRARDELRVLGYTGQVAQTSAHFNYMMGYSYLGSASDEGEVKPETQEAVVEDLKRAKEYLLKAQGLKPTPVLQKAITQALASVDARMRHPGVTPGAPPGQTH